MSKPVPKKKLSKAEKETNRQVDKIEAIKVRLILYSKELKIKNSLTQVLVSKYGLSNIDALLAYDKFFKRFPSGEIKKEDFMEEYKVTANTS